VAYISKRKALKALRRNLERGEEIVSNEERTIEAIVRWTRDTEGLMREVLSENSELYKDFQKFVPFMSLATVRQGVYLLTESIRQIEEYGLISERTQIHPLWYKLGIPLAVVVVTAVASLFLPPVQRLLGISSGSKSELTEAQREMQCKELQVIFHSRLEEFDADYVFSRDSLGVILSRKYRQRTQVIPVEIEKFWKPAKMRRDNIIDSFLVAFEAAGCDINSLRYTRHHRK